MQVLEWLLSLRPMIPFSVERGCQPASNAEIRRWCNSKSVLLNGVLVGFDDKIIFPVTELVFFPKGKRKTTIF